VLNDSVRRVALIGYGLGGETFHAPLISATPGLVLGAVVTRDAGRVAAVHAAFPSARVLNDTDALWADAASYDLVAIASPNATHEPLALRALDAGLNVVVDKPFAATSAGAQRLLDAANERGLAVVPFQNRRWDGDFLTVRRLIANERLGEVFRFESRMERWRAAPKPRWTTPDAADAAEGIVYDLGTHLVDQALVLFGPASRVYAEADSRNPASRVDDDSFIAITHVNGVRSRLVVSTSTAIPGPRFSVYGSRGTFVKHGVDPQEDSLKAGRRPGNAGWGEDDAAQWGTLHDGTTATKIRTEAGAYETFYAGVARALIEGSGPPVSPAEAVQSLAVIEAALQSAASREVVNMR
jgi:scyllo-inositol 2-dehydrogenase (NADP+)